MTGTRHKAGLGSSVPGPRIVKAAAPRTATTLPAAS
jgi:hypothetical protein